MEIGRNEPCPCGSGKKYKKCCLEQDEQFRRSADQDSGLTPNVMGSRDTPEGSLRHKVVEFSRAIDRDHVYLFAAKEAWELGNEVDYSGTEGFPAHIDLMDYFIHDYVIPDKGKRILDLFYDAQRASLTSAEASILDEWLDNRRALYEVQAIRPGEGVDVKDLLTEELYRVYDKSASRRFGRWDIFYARLMLCEGQWTLTGTAHSMGRQFKDEVIAYLKENLKSLQAKDPTVTLKRYLKTSSPQIKKFIQDAQEMPTGDLRASTGEVITPSEAAFAVADFSAVKKALENMNDFADVGESDEIPGGLRYDWLQRGASAQISTGNGSPLRRGIRVVTHLVGGPSLASEVPTLGNLTLTAQDLLASCLSQERMDLLVALLETRLGSLIQFKCSKRTPLEAMRSENPSERAAIPQDIQNEIMTKFFNDYYREWKEKPIAALGGLSPRQAAQGPKARGALIELLKDLENNEERMKKNGQVVYGADRLRAELGLAETVLK